MRQKIIAKELRKRKKEKMKQNELQTRHESPTMITYTDTPNNLIAISFNAF